MGFLVISVLAGVVEEPGWRGYAQDGLQRRYPVLAAGLIVGLAWSVWHLPLFFIEGSFQEGLGFATREFWLFGLAIPVQSVTYAWIYVGTGGSIFSVVLFHVLQDVAGEVFSLEGAEGLELAIWAGLAVLVTVGSLRRLLGRATSRLSPAGKAAAASSEGGVGRLQDASGGLTRVEPFGSSRSACGPTARPAWSTTSWQR